MSRHVKRARVVIASHIYDATHERKFWFEEPGEGWWSRDREECLLDDWLVDPVPLIEEFG